MRSFSAYCSSWALSWGRRHMYSILRRRKVRRARLKLAILLLNGSGKAVIPGPEGSAWEAEATSTGAIGGFTVKINGGATRVT
ncbi:MAG: hypothetical protein WBW93_14460 [Steroidobacteraceae bacterium]